MHDIDNGVYDSSRRVRVAGDTRATGSLIENTLLVDEGDNDEHDQR